MSEVMQRKDRINGAIAALDASRFAAELRGWLEATAYMRALTKLEKGAATPLGVVPRLTDADLKDAVTTSVAEDAIFAFCLAAALQQQSAALSALEAEITQRFGADFPGAAELARTVRPAEDDKNLEEVVGQIIKAMREGKALDAADVWNAGLRLLERVRTSNFSAELMPILARWMRAQWAFIIVHQRFNLARPRFTVPDVENVLAVEADDQAFVAALLLAGGGALDASFDPAYRTHLEALAKRA
jgi:hypothetical protein